jgi:tRNA G26 N,N-dimethylase Trm1
LSDTVLGIFTNLNDAEKAMAEIQRMGYSASETESRRKGWKTLKCSSLTVMRATA